MPPDDVLGRDRAAAERPQAETLACSDRPERSARGVVLAADFNLR